jgi:uncharacterized protein YndB with AHSA1/START domain
MTHTGTTHTVTSVTVEIAAPASFVWDVLVDYPRYPEWNPYTIAVETTLEIGDRIDLTLPNPDGPNPDGTGGTMLNREFIRVVDPPHHLRYDTGEEYPGLLGMRDQYVTELGPDRCRYHTTDTLSGELADLVMETNGAWIKAGFDAVAHALRARAELLHAAR